VVKRLFGRKAGAAPPQLPAAPAEASAAGSRDEAYDELRVGFTASVSHELRTPLARLLALLDGAGLPGADPHAILASARTEVEEMRELVDDILFLSELETGQRVVGLGQTRVVPVLEAAAAGAAVSADHSAVRIEVSGDDQLTVPVRERMLRLVAGNLVSNAIRYGGSGSTLRLDVSRVGDRVEITAADDGPGVPASDIPRLFERFYRADRARASRGTGLGLAIVKHVVTSAGGTVDAGPGAGGRGLVIRCTFPAG
jgi:signal transduction histidine kinase